MHQAFIALWRLIELPDGPDPYAQGQNRILEPVLAARLPRFGRDIDPLHALDAIRQLCQEVEQLHPALAALDIPIPREMPEATASLAALAEAAIQSEL